MSLDSGLKLKLVSNCRAAYLVSRERVAFTALIRALLLVWMSELVCTPTLRYLVALKCIP
jgi:hypothetical protein